MDRATRKDTKTVVTINEVRLQLAKIARMIVKVELILLSAPEKITYNMSYMYDKKHVVIMTECQYL